MMARKTKAEWAAEHEAAEAARQAVAQATYTDRMMAVFERANRVNFELQVMNSKFVMRDRDADFYRRDDVFALTAAWSPDNDEVLRDLTWRVESKEEAEAEAERKRQLRANALAKLSQEEREELGL
jgi:hypothetical protein